jgi:hypothetical protein
MTVKLLPTGRYEVASNDRGNWVVQPSGEYTSTLVGFHGEQAITIFASGMQSGVVDLCVVLWKVDGFLTVARRTVRFADEEAAVNELIAAVRAPK